MESLNWVDYSFIICVVLSSVISFYRGLIKETITLVAWILALVLAYQIGPAAGNLFSFIKTEIVRTFIGSAAIFLLIIIIGTAISTSLNKILSIIGFSFLDKTAGIAFGATRGMLIIMLTTIGITATPLQEQTFWLNSTFAPTVTAMSESITKAMPENVKTAMTDILENVSMTS